MADNSGPPPSRIHFLNFVKKRLAPAYDLTPCAGLSGEHACMVNGKGRDITDDDLIAAAATCGIAGSKVRTVIAGVGSALKKAQLL